MPKVSPRRPGKKSAGKPAKKPTSQRPPVAPGFRVVRSEDGIYEYELSSNGLQVLLLPDHSARAAVVNIVYRVGSRNESLGNTGSTHILEHMLFKGSPKFNRDNGRDSAMYFESLGAYVNATTWTDRTNYFMLVPREHFEQALALEADRMRGAYLKAEDLATEMVVVRNEYERGENNPSEALEKQVWANAFQVHPYHHSTIGWQADIEGVTIEKLKAFHDVFYWPDNATLVLIGDFEVKETLRLVKKYYGKIPRAPHPIPHMSVVEPKQEGERRVEVTRAGETPLLMVAHKIPSARHEDTPALQLLSVLLAGGRSARLYRHLVDRGHALRVSSTAFLFHDESLLLTTAELPRSGSVKKLEDMIMAEYRALAQKLVSVAEFKRAYAGFESALLFARDGALSVSSVLTEFVALGDWTLYTKFLNLLARVTPEDIVRVAKKYLIEDTKTVGVFRPLPPSRSSGRARS